VEALLGDQLEATSAYRLVERLADWGVAELYRQAQEGEIDFIGILDQIAAKSNQAAQ